MGNYVLAGYISGNIALQYSQSGLLFLISHVHPSTRCVALTQGLHP